MLLTHLRYSSDYFRPFYQPVCRKKVGRLPVCYPKWSKQKRPLWCFPNPVFLFCINLAQELWPSSPQWAPRLGLATIVTTQWGRLGIVPQKSRPTPVATVMPLLCCFFFSNKVQVLEPCKLWMLPIYKVVFLRPWAPGVYLPPSRHWNGEVWMTQTPHCLCAT